MKNSVFTKALTAFCSLALTASVFAAAPNNVTGDVDLEIQGDGISVSWAEATNLDGSAVDHYRVYVDTMPVGDAQDYTDMIDTPNASLSYLVTEFDGAELKENIKYYVSVTAVNAQGEESMSYSQESSILFNAQEGEESEDAAEGVVEGEEVHASAPEATNDFVQVVSAVANHSTSITVAFNTVVSLPESVNDAFSILSSDGSVLEIVSAKVNEAALSVVIETVAQTDLEKYTVTALSSVTDVNGNPVVSGVMDTATFIGTAEEFHAAFFEEEDTTAPEDVTALTSSYKLNASAEDYTVTLDWVASENSAGDLDHHNYYEKTTDDFGVAVRVGKDSTSYQRVLEGGERYTFKVSTVDTNGNESDGSLTSIILPETGPAALLGLMAMFSAGVAHVVRRRK